MLRIPLPSGSGLLNPNHIFTVDIYLRRFLRETPWKINALLFDLVQIAALLIILTLLVKPLGSYMARVYQGERTWLSPVLAPLENLLYKVAAVDRNQEMDWKQYAVAMLIFNGLGVLVVFAILLLQGWLPLNPEKFPGFSWDLGLNTAVSFVTNTNWQFYSGESTASYFSPGPGPDGAAVRLRRQRHRHPHGPDPGLCPAYRRNPGELLGGSDPGHPLHPACRCP